jgi:hypothetical protein
MLALRDASADPDVPYVELGTAKDKVRTALRRLPELAREPVASAGDQPTWYLEFDDPGSSDARVPDVEVLARLDIDPLTIAGDDNYWARICAQPNLPTEVKKELEELS